MNPGRWTNAPPGAVVGLQLDTVASQLVKRFEFAELVTVAAEPKCLALTR